MLNHDVEDLERIARFWQRNESLRRVVVAQAVAIALLCVAILGLVGALIK
jgi:hypothetical protein